MAKMRMNPNDSTFARDAVRGIPSSSSPAVGSQTSSRTRRRSSIFRRPIDEYELAPETLARDNGHLSRKGLMVNHGTMVDATIIGAPSSTKNADRERDPEMKQTKKGNQYYFGMKRTSAPTRPPAWCTRW